MDTSIRLQLGVGDELGALHRILDLDAQRLDIVDGPHHRGVVRAVRLADQRLAVGSEQPLPDEILVQATAVPDLPEGLVAQIPAGILIEDLLARRRAEGVLATLVLLEPYGAGVEPRKDAWQLA